MLYCDETFFTF